MNYRHLRGTFLRKFILTIVGRLLDAGIHATNHQLGLKAGGQLIEQIYVAGPVNTRTDSYINIRAII